MAIKKQPKLTPNERRKVAQEAAHSERLPILAQKIDATLSLSEQWRAITEEHKEVILFRLSAGDTIKNICRAMGIPSGPVYMLRHCDDEFAQRYDMAIRAGAHALVDEMREVSRDPTLSENSKSIELKALQWIASRHNRKDYGEQIKVEHNQTPSLNMPDWMGNIVEGQIIPPVADAPPSGDPLDTDKGDAVE